MELTIKELLNSQVAINEIMALSLNVKASYAISKNVRKIIPILEDYNKASKEVKKELMDKYFVKEGDDYKLSEDKKNYILQEGKTAEQYTEELDKATEEALNQVEEIDVHKITKEDLKTAKGEELDIKPVIFVGLHFIFNE